jgi:RNA polymerase sigma-70 factor (ECF subfamily)
MRPEDDAGWLDRFHAGESDVMDRCYRDHFRPLKLTVWQILHLEVDAETVVNEIFLQLLSNPELRRSYTGGRFRAWLTTVARNRAIDHQRRYGKEQALDDAPAEVQAGADPGVGADVGPQDSAAGIERSVEAHLFAERFRETLPPKWVGVFDMCWLADLDQRTAAARLGIARATLAYRAHKIRGRLRRFVQRGSK